MSNFKFLENEIKQLKNEVYYLNRMGSLLEKYRSFTNKFVFNCQCTANINYQNEYTNLECEFKILQSEKSKVSDGQNHQTQHAILQVNSMSAQNNQQHQNHQIEPKKEFIPIITDIQIEPKNSNGGINAINAHSFTYSTNHSVISLNDLLKASDLQLTTINESSNLINSIKLVSGDSTASTQIHHEKSNSVNRRNQLPSQLAIADGTNTGNFHQNHSSQMSNNRSQFHHESLTSSQMEPETFIAKVIDSHGTTVDRNLQVKLNIATSPNLIENAINQAHSVIASSSSSSSSSSMSNHNLQSQIFETIEASSFSSTTLPPQFNKNQAITVIQNQQPTTAYIFSAGSLPSLLENSMINVNQQPMVQQQQTTTLITDGNFVNNNSNLIFSSKRKSFKSCSNCVVEHDGHSSNNNNHHNSRIKGMTSVISRTETLSPCHPSSLSISNQTSPYSSLSSSSHQSLLNTANKNSPEFMTIDGIDNYVTDDDQSVSQSNNQQENKVLVKIEEKVPEHLSLSVSPDVVLNGDSDFVELYRCDFTDCLFSTTLSSNFTNHLRKFHQVARPFKCNYQGCNASFKEKYKLKVHNVVHTGEKPFVCSEPGCNSRFSQSGHLSRHRKLHSSFSEKYCCTWPECTRTFAQKHSLRYHLMMHRGEKPWTCSIDGCGRSYIEKWKLAKHERIKHHIENSNTIESRVRE